MVRHADALPPAKAGLLVFAAAVTAMLSVAASSGLARASAAPTLTQLVGQHLLVRMPGSTPEASSSAYRDRRPSLPPP